MSSNAELALQLAGRGWYVFPCKPDKKPYWNENDLPNGKDNATLETEQIRLWWKRWPDALIGVYCEKSGFFVVDIDNKNGVDGIKSWVDLVTTCGGGERVKGSLAQITPGGGYHLFYKLPNGLKIPNNAGKLAPGLDLRSNGYICTGGPYRLIDGGSWFVDLMDAPAWLLGVIRQMGETPRGENVHSAPQIPPGEAALFWYNRYESLARKGNRNDTLYHMGLQLNWSDVPLTEAESLAVKFAGSKGLTEKEALATMRSAYKAQKREAATLPGYGRSNGNGHRSQPEEPESPPMNLEEMELQSTADNAGDIGQPAQADKEAAKPESKERRRDPMGLEYVEFLAQRGYTFRLCELDDSLWVNDERMSDPLEAEIKTLLRDNGYPKVNVAADAYLAHARKLAFHPVIDFLKSLQWDGADHIGALAQHIEDKHGNASAILKRWFVGAVARPMTRGKQNRVLVLEGDQGLGKSHLARWIASPMEGYFSEAMPDPDNKDSRLALATTWIWEIKELGSVTRRADRESLKAWLTLESVSERMPFGKYPIYKPAMTSFIATVNDEGGFFNDPTGSRRYMTLAVKKIDWAYTKHVDPCQLWAQALALYNAGEDWNLTPEEQKQIAAVNDEYEFTLPSHDWLDRYIEECEGAFLESETIRLAMAGAGNFGKDSQLSREIAGWMKKHGYEPAKEYVDLKVLDESGMPTITRKQVRGYRGVILARKYSPSYDDV